MSSVGLDWAALILGTAGTLIWAANNRWSRFAGLLWLASSLIWLGYGYLNDLPSLAAREVVATGLYAIGGYRWI